MTSPPTPLRHGEGSKKRPLPQPLSDTERGAKSYLSPNPSPTRRGEQKAQFSPTPLRHGEGSKKLNFSQPLSDTERGAKSSIFPNPSPTRRGEQKAQFFATPLRHGEGSKKLNFSLPLSDTERGAKSSIFRCPSPTRRGEQKAQFFVGLPFPFRRGKKLNFSLVFPFRFGEVHRTHVKISSLSVSERFIELTLKYQLNANPKFQKPPRQYLDKNYLSQPEITRILNPGHQKKV